MKSSETVAETAVQAPKPAAKPRKTAAKKKTKTRGTKPRGTKPRATPAESNQPDKPAKAEPPRENQPARKAPAVVADDSDFGAGILAPEPVSTVPTAAPPPKPPAPKKTRRTRGSTAAKKPAAAEEQTPEPRSSDDGSDSQEEKPSRSSRRRHRSRTQRLAEEAEVIATISGETPPESDIETPTASPAEERSQGDERTSDEAAADKPRKPRRRGRRKRSPGERTTNTDVTAPRAADDGEDGAPDSLDGAQVSFEEGPRETEPTRSTRGRRRKTPATADSAASPKTSSTASAADREMLINVAESEECRIAIMSNHRLDELHIERAAASSNVGNIYKGRVTNVEPSIQAAFIDFGLAQHGFLHISDLHPQYFPDSKGETEQVGKKTPRRQRPPIQTCLKRGSEVIVQVIKEGIGTKGPTLSSYISLPGRFLVMMPGMEQLGVSRKIEDEDTRRKMRDILGQLSLPKDMGFIVRTAGVDRPKRDLQRDLNFLSRLWKKVDQRIKKEPAPAELYKESDLVIRTIRDVYDSSLKRIVVDNEVVANRVREFLRIASPRAHDVVEVYTDAEPLFHRYGIEREIDRLHSKTVPLPCGGSLVIEQTEALVAIDVNSGRFRVPENAEETAFRVNLEAADEIARQLRLRDLGGLIICDLIDMGIDRHRRQVEKVFSDALRKHKERAKILRISRFGLIEMTRQRQRPSLAKSHFRECPKCAGSGRIKAPESVALEVMRSIKLACQRSSVARIDVKVSTPVANDILNRKRHMLTDIERDGGQTIIIHATESFAVDQQHISCSDRRGREVQAEATPRDDDGAPRKERSRSSRRGGRRGRRNRG